jgi:hypothetical protein
MLMKEERIRLFSLSYKVMKLEVIIIDKNSVIFSFLCLLPIAHKFKTKCLKNQVFQTFKTMKFIFFAGLFSLLSTCSYSSPQYADS